MPIPVAKRNPVEYDVVKMTGGWDQLTPTLSLSPGSLRDVTNYELSALPGGGYSRIAGYERFDGRPSPSAASYTTIQLESFTNVPTVGQTLTGNTSGATGVIIALGGNFIVVTKVVGIFINTEVVKVGALTIGTATPLNVIFSSLQVAQYAQLAADVYRADIVAVPGSGPVRGVVGLTVAGVDKVFAFRNNTGGTAVNIYEATSSGWVQVSLLYEISFTAGAVAVPADGATLTQGAVTATVKRVCLQTGAWTGAGTGRLIITAPSGGNFAAGAATISGGATCTLSGIQTAITIAPNGRFRFWVANLGGQAETVRIYGCDGINRGFEFDGATYVPITTGTSPDVPSHVIVHQKHVFFAFRSSAVHSGPGLPFKWGAADGASEIVVGNTVTNFLTQPGIESVGALGIISLDNYHTLYGTGISNWSLVGLNAGVGGVARTAQSLNDGFWLDDPGVINLRASQQFGNFQTSSVTQHLAPFMDAQRSLTNDSVIHRGKSQYRLYFSDGQALYVTIANGKFLGATRISTTDVFYCVTGVSRSDFSERLYAGATNSGHVYELDKGSSFDGADISASMTFNWNFSRSPRMVKRYRKLSLEMQGNFYANVTVNYSVAYNTTERLQANPSSYDSNFSGVPMWDSFTWDAFTWDGNTLAPTEIQLRGSGENIQLTVSSRTNYIHPYTINSVIYNISGRRGLR